MLKFKNQDFSLVHLVRFICIRGRWKRECEKEREREEEIRKERKRERECVKRGECQSFQFKICKVKLFCHIWLESAGVGHLYEQQTLLFYSNII